MLTATDNELLTRVGPGTPMGDYFRRFWLPIFIDDELPGPDCDPVRTRVLGEDLIAFRDTNGEIGVLDAYCPHRRVPMYFGRNEECGLRCVYHGRKFDRHGNCVDYPSAPPSSRLRERGGTKAYPTVELAGLIWVYMGPNDLMPSRPPDLPFTRMGRNELILTKYLVESNWLQNLEGDIDLEHLHWLHASTIKGNRQDGLIREDGMSTDRFAHYSTVDTPYGMAAAARWRKAGGEYNWRVNQHILPSHMQIPVPQGHTGEISFWVPADNGHCWRLLVWGAEAMPMVPGADGRLVRLESLLPVEQGTFQFSDGVIVDSPLPVDRKGNNYGLDRARQRSVNATGLAQVPTEDQALTEGMGHVLDRTAEDLDATDRPILGLRNRLLTEVRDFQAGAEPYAPAHPEIFDVMPCDIDSPIVELSDLLEAAIEGRSVRSG